MSLTQYRKKRNFKLTTEPYGQCKSSENSHYYMQKHAARHLHYDLRLELNGVLKSWAIPKGPSLDSEIKRLAVQVEDHPVEYGTFEGVIPAGQYGGGTVMLWDAGSWACVDQNPNAAYKKGHLNLILKGKKLKGLWHLVRLKNDPKNWLFFKANDKYAQPKKNYNIIEKKPSSIISGHSLEEISDQYANKNKPKIKQGPITKIQTKLNNHIKKSKKTAMPTIIHPELATLADTPPIGNQWCHEIKYDGYRIISFIKNKKIKLTTRNQKAWTKKFPTLVKALQHLAINQAILDGELVALDKKGRSNFQLLQDSIKNKESSALAYYIFDLLHYEGSDLTSLSLLKRKQQLQLLIPNSSTVLLYSDHTVGKGKPLFKKACQLALEGIVSKDIDSPYIQKRSRSWLKIKCNKRQEFIVVGFTAAKGKRPYFGALLLAVYARNKQLQFCGHVGTGFTEDTLKNMYQLLNKFKTTQSQVKITSAIRQVTWVKPRIIVEVEFSEWTKKGLLRHPRFKGLRYDKKANQITREKIKKTTKIRIR